MIAVDTNVLVRLLVKDDEAQTRKVVRLFRRLDADRERTREGHRTGWSADR